MDVNPLVHGALATKPREYLITKYLDSLVSDLIRTPYGDLSPEVFPEKNLRSVTLVVSKVS